MRAYGLLSAHFYSNPDFYYGKSIAFIVQFRMQILFSRFTQVGWCLTFGYRAVLHILHFFNGDLQCFYRIGAYDVCKTTQRLSIDMNLFLLMTQSLISRILVPGMSNFVNASVRRLHLSQHALRLNRLVRL
jgi:hypothetical protein